MEHDATPTPPPPPPVHQPSADQSSGHRATSGVMPMPKQRSTWPTVLGIFCIVFGILGIIGYGICQPIGLFVAPLMADSFEAAAQNDPQMQEAADSMSVATQNLVPNLVVAIVAAALAITLLVGGIKLTNRKPGGARILIYWAAFKMVWAVGAIMVGIMTMNQQMEQMEQMAESTGGQQVPQGMMSVASGLGFVGQAIGFLFYCALPIFCLIFLLRRKGREEVASWRPPAAPGQHLVP